MSVNTALMQLCANNCSMVKYFPCQQVENFMTLPNNNNSNEFMIPRLCDSIREIILNIHLPPLDSNQCYKNNLLKYLIQNIRIKANYLSNMDISLSTAYIQNLLHEMHGIYSNKLLFYNLPSQKRQKMSKTGFTITLPLKLSNFVINPSE